MTEEENPWLQAAAATKDALAAAHDQNDRQRGEGADGEEHEEAAAEAAGRRPRGRLTRFHSAKAEEPEPGSASNPFLPAPAVDPYAEPDEDGDDRSPVMVRGPQGPTGAPAPVYPVLQLPTRFHTDAARTDLAVQVAGLHGGAGVDTVTGLLGEEAINCGVGLGQLVDPDIPVLFVARTHAHGLDLVKRVGQQAGSGGFDGVIHVLGVILVDDAPHLSQLLNEQLHSVQKVLPASWRLRWSEDIRHSTQPPGEPTGGRLRRTRKSILDQAHKLQARIRESNSNNQQHHQKGSA